MKSLLNNKKNMHNVIKQVLIWVSLIILMFLIKVIIQVSEVKPFEIERVRIDSISVESQHSNLPEEKWFYHTNAGVISSKTLSYSVGDSIDVKIIKIKK